MPDLCFHCAQPLDTRAVYREDRRGLCSPCAAFITIDGVPREASMVVAALPAGLRWTDDIRATAALFTLRPSPKSRVFVLASMAVWYVIVAAMIVPMSRSDEGRLFFLLALVVTVGASWLALGRALNRWRATLDRRSFVVRARPVPWRGLSVSTDTIIRFDAIEVRDDGSTLWIIRLISHGGKEKRLPFPTDSEAQAKFVASKLNLALGTLRAPRGYRS